jgi:hypothetical protein
MLIERNQDTVLLFFAGFGDRVFSGQERYQRFLALSFAHGRSRDGSRAPARACRPLWGNAISGASRDSFLSARWENCRPRCLRSGGGCIQGLGQQLAHRLGAINALMDGPAVEGARHLGRHAQCDHG